MTEERFTHLFTKHLHGTCSNSEYQEFTALVNSGKYDQTASRLLDEHWTVSKEAEMDTGKSDRILAYIYASKQVPTRRKRVFETAAWTGIAAAVVFIAIFSVFSYHPVTTVPGAAKVQQLSVIPARAAAGKFITTNEHRKITLPDGSTVVLNNNSTLSVTSDFNKTIREVHIEGEGYFDIVHDTKKPFIVISGEVKTTVLGTAFNVKAYRDSKVEVTVTRGKVSVLSGRNILGILTPNRKIVVAPELLKPVISTVVAKNAIEWQENDLFFHNISFEEATLILSKKFNTPITFVNKNAKRCHFTATFLQGETLDEVLKVICSFNNTKYYNTAGGISIEGPGC